MLEESIANRKRSSRLQLKEVEKMEHDEQQKKDRGYAYVTANTSGNKDGILSAEAIHELEQEKERVLYYILAIA